MNQLPEQYRCAILRHLVEGNSLRSTSRLLDFSINTVSKLMVDAGKASLRYQNTTLVDLPCRLIQVDEMWSFVYSRDQTDDDFDTGEAWIWIAMCPETKLVPCWHIGPRDKLSANIFIHDLCKRFNHKIQLTSDGLQHYRDAVEHAFGDDVDYAMLVKQYGETRGKSARGLYEGAIKRVIIGNPDMRHVTTAHIERQNLTMRMSNKRLTRKTNAFSKKLENHKLSVALHFMHYNFCRIHKTLRVTPAMAAGVTDRLWDIVDIVKLF